MEEVLLVKKAIKGDRSAFEELISICFDRLYKEAYLRCKYEDDAKEIVQETICKAYKSINKLKEPKYFKTWISKILINVSNDYLRYKGMVELNHNENDYVTEVHKDDNIEVKIDLYNAIDELEEPYKDAIILRYIEDLKLEEIDKEMEDFQIDKNKFDNITYSFDKDTLIKSAIDTAQVDIKKRKFKNNIIKVASVFLFILSIGIYNPALAHYSPVLMKGLEKINDFLKIDEITSFLEIDTIIPKAVLDKDNNIEFLKMPHYEVPKKTNDEKIVIDTVHDQGKISDEYQLISFIHKMSNQIINALDGKKYGIVEITPENMETAMNSIENINNIDARDYLFYELDKWRNGDFSNGV